MPPVELTNALVAIRWSTDYLLKTVAQPGWIVVQVETQREGFRMSLR
ncbi:putative cellulase [Helianthus anomalus]